MGRSRSLFKCGDCGTRFIANNNKVLTGHVTSCGCRRNGGERRLKPIPPGTRCGFLTIIGPAEPRRKKNGHLEAQSHAICDCGKKCVIQNVSVRKGNTKNCGCRLSQRSLDRKYAYLVAQIRCRNRRFSQRYEFSIEQIKYLVHLPCLYCGRVDTNAFTIKHGRVRPAETLRCNGIDRVDSTQSYAPRNVVPCCYMCNLAKNKFPLERFIAWLQRHGSTKTAEDILKNADQLGHDLLLMATTTFEAATDQEPSDSTGPTTPWVACPTKGQLELF